MSHLSSEVLEAAGALASKFVRYVNESVTPFHAVANTTARLAEAGFSRLDERSSWCLSPGSKFYVTRNDASVVAFVVGKNFTPGNGIKLVGAHTDSPNLQLKPAAANAVKRGGCVGARVQTYGGGLWHTWFDRDLTLAGRLIVNDDPTKPLQMKTRLFRVARPILRIPTLAIHLRTAAERESFAPNSQTHVAPIFATEEALKTSLGDTASILTVLAKEAGVSEPNIIDFDISLVDTQPAVIGGACGDFIFAPRIDNLLSCFAAQEALINAIDDAIQDSTVTMVAFFDHEEVGSSSFQGAGGSFVCDVIDRVSDQKSKSETLAKSFLLSVDGAHAVHPNYSDKHEDAHSPVMHRGPVVKYNANARYATDAYSAAIVQQLAQIVSVPLQRFAVKNDSPCGSTIGPILTTLTGMRGMDVGNPMWSMHSVRETAGVVDLLFLTRLIESFIKNYSAVSIECAQ